MAAAGDPRYPDNRRDVRRAVDQLRLEVGRIDVRIDQLTTDLERIAVALEVLLRQMAGVPEHIAAVCQLVAALRVILAPVAWLVAHGRRLLIWIGASAASLYGIDLLLQSYGIVRPWEGLIAAVFGGG